MVRHALKLPAAPLQLSTKHSFVDSHRREREPLALEGKVGAAHVSGQSWAGLHKRPCRQAGPRRIVV